MTTEEIDRIVARDERRIRLAAIVLASVVLVAAGAIMPKGPIVQQLGAVILAATGGRLLWFGIQGMTAAMRRRMR